jgi:hypothetical protein
MEMGEWGNGKQDGRDRKELYEEELDNTPRKRIPRNCMLYPARLLFSH